MAGVLLLSCFLLAVAGVISVQSATHPVRGDAQQLTEEPLREKRTAPSQTGKSDDGLGALLAQQAAQLSSLKNKLHALEISQLTAKSELQSTKSELQSTKSELQSELQSTKSELRSELQSTKSELQSTKSKLQSELQSTKSELQSTKSDLQSTKAELQTSQAKIQTKMEKLKKGKGSSFVRWGRKICPNNTTLVYTGVAGGKNHYVKGSGTNTLCLTRTPQFDNTAKPPYYGYLYGAEYQNIPGHDDHDVPCSVCLARQSTTIMVPATLTCPPGWTPHYTGHLASERYAHYGGEYVCLDGSPEDDSSGVRNDEGLLFYYVVTVCGSLPCPPYINDKVVTCVVCSK
ncbi:uncharacterized protein [Littorina saxatilis]|uniref:uncharacterized protein isoform X2 n=1 Tax=Littorina saxatilis TaxID=31220 RepID=UPI0038B447A8